MPELFVVDALGRSNPEVICCCVSAVLSCTVVLYAVLCAVCRVPCACGVCVRFLFRSVADMFGIPFVHLPIPPKDQGGKRVQEVQVRCNG